MKKLFYILFICLTLFAVVTKTYKAFFSIETELAEKNTEKDEQEKKAIDDKENLQKEKYLIVSFLNLSVPINKNNYFITHSYLLPAPFTLMLEIPPDAIPFSY